MSFLTGSDRLLVLAPHPDDESLATGGLILRALARGAAVRVLFATDGDNNPWPQRFVERRWTVSPRDRARWGRRRYAEAHAALAVLGLGPQAARFLHLPDRGLTRLLGEAPQKVLAPLGEELGFWRPTLIAAPSPEDTHPDHGALALFLRKALAAAPGFSPRCLEYRIHPGPWRSWPGLLELPLTPAEIRRKRAAILRHATQMALSRRRFLRYASPVERFFPVAEPAAIVPKRLFKSYFAGFHATLR